MTMMEQQCLATLQTLLADGGAGTIEQPLLERFYKHCARQPAVRLRQPATVALKTLLFHYPCLRPAIQAALREFVADHWRIYATETPIPNTVPDASHNDSPPDLPDRAPKAVASSRANRSKSPAIREDWFDQLLNGIRILLFR
jgi:hypothetical protein